jgi:tetratricopeptide (TPR) repeat protein
LLLVREGRFANALRELEAAAQNDATAVEAWTAAAASYYALGQFRDAVNVARLALNRDEEALDARRWLAAALYDLGITPEAVIQLKLISAQAPADPRPERLLGLINKDNEQFAEAVAHYRESLRRNSRQADRVIVLTELAEALVRLSQFEEAIDVLRNCDQSATVLAVEAECLKNLGQTADAEKRLLLAIERDPGHFSARMQLGTLYLLQSQPERAVRVLEEAVQIVPSSSQARFQLSQAYIRYGDSEKAEAELQRMRVNQAVEREYTDLHEAAARQPDDVQVRYQMGILAKKLGKPELARLWFRAALALDRGHSDALAALAAMEAQ